MNVLFRFCALVIALAGSVVLAAQQPQFTGATDLVRIFVTPVDRDGRVVADLTQEDFEIRADGRVRPVAVFSNEPQPIAVIVMLDRSGSVMTTADVVTRGAEVFLRRLLPRDVARIGSFGDSIQILPEDFTGSQVELITALRSGLQPDRSAGSPVWTSVSRSVAALSPLPVRRVVLLFSDGHDAPEYGQTRVKFSDLQQQVGEHDVMVYAIGVPGAIQSRAASQFSPGRVMMGQTFSPPDPDMKKLAAESGGGFIELDKKQLNLETVFARVADELHSQFLLGFTPERLDGKWHDLEVRVKRPGVTVRARKQYIASPRK